MKTILAILMCLWAVMLGNKFVAAKIANDTSIADDTRRVAVAVEAMAAKK